MLALLDYIFWRFERHFRKHDLYYIPDLQAATALSFMFITPIACISICLIDILHLSWCMEKLLFVVFLHLVWLAMSVLDYRYLYHYKIVQNNYELFNTRWGKESKKLRKRRKWLIIALFIFNCIIIPTASIVMTILYNKRFIILGHV